MVSSKQKKYSQAEITERFKNHYHAGSDYHNFCHRGSDKEWRKRFNIGDIYTNAAICKSCGWFIRSKNRHDFVTCTCGNISVDGGSYYARRVWKDGAEFTDVIEYFKGVKKIKSPDKPI